MATIAGYTSTIEFSSEASANYSEWSSCTDVSFSPSRNLLDDTAFDSSNTAVHTRLAGLKDATITANGFYENGDTAIGIVMSRYADGAAIWCQITVDGTNGVNLQGLVESYEIGSTVDGLVTFSCTLQATAAHDTTIH